MKFPKSEAKAATEPVSVFERDRTVLRAVAGAAGTYPAIIVQAALASYLRDNPELGAVAEAALAVATSATPPAVVEPTAEEHRDAIRRGS
jgi:hypothetical protein